MAKNDSKYGDGVDQKDLPFYTKGEDLYSPKITEDDPVNAGAWKVYEENEPKR